MPRQLLLLAIMLAGLARGEIIDRIAVIVGKHVIKLSDIDRDLRLIEFLNRQPLSNSPEFERKATDRLIDQQIIRDELATGGYGRASDGDADALLREIRQNRYANSESGLKQALAAYALNEDQLRAQLLWQMTVLRFIDQRFRTGVLVTDDEVRNYYDQHPDSKKVSFQIAAPQIRTTLEGEQVNTQFESWLEGARKSEHIEYRDAAFGNRTGGAK